VTDRSAVSTGTWVLYNHGYRSSWVGKNLLQLSRRTGEEEDDESGILSPTTKVTSSEMTHLRAETEFWKGEAS